VQVENILTGFRYINTYMVYYHSSFVLSQKKAIGKHKMTKNIIKFGVHMSPFSNIKNPFDVAQPKYKQDSF
jgi:hypothetical protein